MKLYGSKRSDKTSCRSGCCGNKLARRYSDDKIARRAAKKRQRRINSKLTSER